MTFKSIFTSAALASALILSSMAYAEDSKLSDIEQAYEKEFTLLDAQKKALTKRLTDLSIQERRDLKKSLRDIEKLQDSVLAIDSRSQIMNELLVEAERGAESDEDNRLTLDATYAQANDALGKYGIEVTDGATYKDLNDEDMLKNIFADAEITITDLARVHIDTGSFYLLDGSKVDGKLVKIGNIATYGVAPEGAGALAPAGGGHLKLWTEDSTAIAQALVAGQSPDSLKIFVYENIDAEVKVAEGKTTLSIIESGGPIGWVIVILGGVVGLMVLLRIAFLKHASADRQKLCSTIDSSVQEGRLDDAATACKKQNGAISRVLSSTIRNLDRDRDHLEDIISEAILHENGHLDRFGTTIMVIASVAPLLGLLGTVTGMISTFDVITEHGTGDPKMLSGGISEALVTTELGLIVAIPALLMGNLLAGWAENIKSEMEQTALRITNIYQNHKDGIK